MTFAVVPAAGQSTRMGRPKLALPLAGRTVLEHVVAALRDGGADVVVVVVGPHTADLGAVAERAGASVCRLQAATADMRASVEHGLAWIEERCRPSLDDDWLLAPADHPAVDAEVVRRLRACRASRPEQSLFVPVHNGRRGHPVLLGWRHVAGIRALAAGEGLNRYLRQHEEETVEVPVESAGVLWDVDTPEDYERVVRMLASQPPLRGRGSS
jgi:CTP:molybdopterin cytidylyltransferase MocA